MSTTMTAKERVARVLDGRTPDRVPLSDSYWQTTIDRWRREGLPADVAPEEHFHTNEIVAIGGDYTMQLPVRVIEESGLTRTYWDEEGALRKDLHTPDGWTSQWLEFTIKTKDDWAHHRHRLAFNPSRISAATEAAYRKAVGEGNFIAYAGHACFHPTWMRIGMENELMLMLEDPEFAYELFAAHAQLIIDIFDAMVARGMRFDAARLADDLGYQASPLISPQLYRDLVFPHHKRLCDHFAEHGLKTILHSDGNIAPLIPHFLDAGFSALNPLEAKAGLDIRKLRPQYGELVFYGNIDVRKLAGTREEIEEEIGAKLAVAREHGRYIYHSDHSVPKNVSMANYGFALDLVRKYGSFE
jgi:uroporphyrinogen decarboxylase